MLAAITCHFNPIEYENIVRNYWMFREDLVGADLFTIELSFNGKFEIDDAIHVEGKPEQIMWQKERLLNLLIEQLPKKYDKIAWLDADILFHDRTEWAKNTEKALDKFPMVQVFEKIWNTDSDLSLTDCVPGIIHAGTKTTHAKPGHGWAARRELLEKIPLLDSHIMGGGDTMMYYAGMGMFNNFMLTRTNIEWRRAFMQWARPFYEEIHGNFGCVPGALTHLYHGTYADRQYVERWMILSKNRFNPNPYTWNGLEKIANEPDIKINENGIWEWASDKPDLHEEVAEYFEERKEDEVWISKMRDKK